MATGCHDNCEAAAEANAIYGELQSGGSEVRISERDLRFAGVGRLKTPIEEGEELCAGREGRNQPREADSEGLRFL